MGQMPKGCVDLVITDPPYNIGKDYGGCDDRLPDDEYWALYRRWMAEIYRVMREGALYVSCLSRQLWEIRSLMEDVGFVYAHLLIWHRPNIPMGTTGITLPWVPVSEPIFMFWKGKRQRMLNEVRGVNAFDVLRFTSPQSSFSGDLHRVHPTQKPVGLYRALIARTPGEIVFDPFVGSGTSVVAAKRLGRKFFACDINPKWVQITLGRLDGLGPPGQLELL